MKPKITPQQELAALKSKGLTFSDCIKLWGVDRDSDPYAAAANKKYGSEGQVEIDDTTVLSDSSEGQYVLAWLWIGKDEVAGDS